MSNDVSISMIIDNKFRQINNRNNVNGITLPIKNSLNLDERKIYSWIADKNVNDCNHCHTSFTFINRRHHCRNCGKIFCHNCSDNFIVIPENIKTVDKKYNYLHFRTYLEFLNLNKTLERVCTKCFKSISELKELSKLMLIFDNLPLNLYDMKNIPFVSKFWYKSSKYYFNKVREIQYNFHDHVHTKIEKKILINNKKLFVNHSKWLVQLILITDWNSSNPRRDDLFKLITSTNDKLSCKRLLCTRSCRSNLQSEDIILILIKQITYTPLIKYLIKNWKTNLEKLDESSTSLQIEVYLYIIVNCLHFYKNYTSISIILENFLLDITKDNLSLLNHLFWILTQFISFPESSIYFKTLRLKLVKNLDKETCVLFQNGFDFTQNIISILNNGDENTIYRLKKYFKDYNLVCKNFTLPLNIVTKFIDIDFENIVEIDSKTKPLKIPCITQNSEICNVMIKKEDIRKEEIIMKIIKLMDFFLKTEENLDLSIVTYNIKAITSDYGYIEFVNNSTTLYDIKENKRFTILNWLIEQNKTDILTLRENICKSCAAYCIITYMLGIGDRHLDNIMITDKGKLFHIDFGYILGSDPKVISPEIRLTPEMIDAMGGNNSQDYKKFKNYCGIAYNCIRRHASIFFVMLLKLNNIDSKFKEKYTSRKIKQFIIDRFVPGENYHDAIQQINYRIENNSNTYSETIIDYFHKHCKKSNSTDEKGFKLISNHLSKNNFTTQLNKLWKKKK